MQDFSLELTLGADERKRALVIDDEIETANDFAKRLQAFGFDCDTAYDGMSALGKLRTVEYEIAIVEAAVADALNCHFEIVEGLEELDVNAGLAGTKLSKSLASAEGGVACAYCNIDESFPSLLHVKFGAHDVQVGDKLIL